MAALARLAGLASSAAEARLAALTRVATELRVRLAALDDARRTRAEELESADAALLAGADLRWHRWIEGRRSALNSELARTLTDIARAQAALRKSFGQRLAAEALAEQEHKDRRRLQDRRAERDQLS